MSARRGLLFAVLLALPAVSSAGDERLERADRLVRESAPAIAGGARGEAEAGRLLEALEIYRKLGNGRGQADCHLLLGTLYGRQETYAKARSHYAESAEHQRRLGDRLGAWQALYGLAEASRFSGCQDESLKALEEAREVLAELADPATSIELENLRLVAEMQGLPFSDVAELPALLPAFRGLLLDNFTAMTLLSRAATLRDLARYDEAFATLEEALPKARSLLGVLEAKVLVGMGEIHLARGEDTAAGELFEQARERARALFEQLDRTLKLYGMVAVPAVAVRLDEALALKGLAEVDRRAGRYPEALESLRRALAIERLVGNPPLRAQLVAQMGVVFLAQGRYQEARSRFEQGLELARRAGARDAEAMSLDFLADLENVEGRHEQALRYQEQALGTLREMGHRAQEAQVLMQIGWTYVFLQLPAEALEPLERAAEIARAIGEPHLELGAGLRLAAIYFQAGRVTEARERAQGALMIARRLDSPADEVDALTALGWISIKLGRHEEAAIHLEEALALARESGYRAGEGVAELARGFCFSRLDLDQRASAAYRSALETFQAIGAESYEILALTALGAHHRELGELEATIASWEQAAEKLDAHLGRLRVPDFATAFGAYLPSAVHAALVGLYAVKGDSASAFLHAERSRARAFLDRLGRPWEALEAGGGDETSHRVHILGQKLQHLENEHDRARLAGPREGSSEKTETLLAELSKTREELAGAMRELELHRPEAAALVGVDARTLEQAQAEAVDAETTLVAFYVLEDRVLAWVVDREAAHMLQLEARRCQLEGEIGRFLELVRGGDFDRSAAAALHRSLMAPLLPHVRHRRLVLVPHGVLHELPFAALWDGDRERYLVEDYVLSQAPSASILRFLKAKRSANEGRSLVFGNPDGSLPGAEEEARAIAALYGARPWLGPEASEERLRAAAGEVDLVHLAAHARWEGESPRHSFIELAPGGDHDGRLEVREVFGELDLRGVDLVVLSACDTGRGERSRGDEVLGLTRAFLYAGSPAVVTSAWKVDDRAARFLMETFHRRLRAGDGPAEALRRAQLATSRHGEWSKPAFWASFSLHGDGAPDTPEGDVS